MLQKLYRHTSITTTIIYQSNFIHKDVDDALDAVIGYRTVVILQLSTQILQLTFQL